MSLLDEIFSKELNSSKKYPYPRKVNRDSKGWGVSRAKIF